MLCLVVRRTALTLILPLCTASCSGVTRTPPIVRPTGVAVRQVADLRLPRDSELIVQIVRGGTVRGKLMEVTQDRLELELWDPTVGLMEWSADHADIVLVARVVKMSKGARGWLGAAIGALVSLPFGISMFGDMMVPAALAGALIGRGTGDSRAEVVFERPN
jgi:hypothetical protein